MSKVSSTKVVFSGIKPSGEMHIGNYVGAVKRWVAKQQECKAVYCVVDYHAMTLEYDCRKLLRLTRELVMLLIASGIDPTKSLFYIQSHVSQHAELTWILDCVATFGELSRQTQFKSKASKKRFVTVGLFNYPVLMAADILLFDTDEVPVGDDQRQHVELCRDLAIRFNHRFGETFKVPNVVLPEVGARIKDLQDPMAKMSKSDVSPMGTITMLDPPDRVLKKIKSAVTDTIGVIQFSPDEQPGISNLLELYSGLRGVNVEDAVAEFAGKGYGALKAKIAEVVNETLKPIQERYRELEQDPAEFDRMIQLGAEQAREIAHKKLCEVKKAVGLTLSANAFC